MAAQKLRPLLIGGFMTFLLAPLYAENIRLQFEELPALILAGNQAVKGAATFSESAEKRSGYLLRSYYPNLRFAAGGESFETGNYSSRTEPYGSLEASLNFFRGGKDRLEEELRKAKSDAARASQDRTYRDELAKARRLYWHIVANRELIQTLAQAMKKNEAILISANRRIKQGLTTPADRLEFEIFAVELREETASLNHQIILLEAAIAPLLGKAIGAKFETPAAIPHQHDENILASMALGAAHPEVQFLRANEGILALQKKEALRWWAPSGDIYGGRYLYTLRERDYTNIEDRADTAAGVRFNLTFFDGFHSLAEARSYERQAEGLRLQANYRDQAVQSELFIAKEDLRHDHELIHSSEEKISQAEEYLKRSLDEYDRGVKNSLDILNAHQRYLAFQKEYAERRRAYQWTLADLLKLLGQ